MGELKGRRVGSARSPRAEEFCGTLALVAEYPPPAAGMTVQADMLRQRLEAEGVEVVPVRTNHPLRGVLRPLRRVRGVRGLIAWSRFLWDCRRLAHMAEVRAGHTATLLTTGPNAGQVLVVGGSDRAPNNTATSGCELYHPASGTWSATGSLNESRSVHTATLLPSGQVLVAGGQSALGAVNRSSAELYDPESGTWSLAAPMSVPRAHQSATLLPSGEVLVAGGIAVSGGTESLNSAEIYDPLADSWSATASMATPRGVHGAALLQDGRVIVVGGVSSGVLLSSTEIFDRCLGDADGDGICDDEDLCPGFDDLLDADGDTVPDGCDVCPGSDDLLDADGDTVPDGCDVCPGSDDLLDADGDTVPDGCDLCPGSDDLLDTDGDTVPDGCDLCAGHDDRLDADGDGVPDGCDQCRGDDASGDGDGDGVCADTDCDDSDRNAADIDGCGVCGGDNSTCGIFEDGFESGDTSAWSITG